MQKPDQSRFQRFGGAYFLIVIGVHILALVAMLASTGQPELPGLMLLAYSFGLRHAFDPDHIAAIDNTVRRLSPLRQSAQGSGFYFSMGHSTVVLTLAVGLAVAAGWVKGLIPSWQKLGGLIGSTISGVFLLVIGVINLVLWLQIASQSKNSPHLDKSPKGFFAKWLTPLLKRVDKSSQLYPVGLLFGLGFDTASEVALLALSASTSSTLPWTGILALPLAFTAGMSLMDTADGVAMTKAYGWALEAPVKRRPYNLTVTGISVLAALGIGTVEIVQLLTTSLGLKSQILTWVSRIDLSNFGFILVAVLLGLWGLVMAVNSSRTKKGRKLWKTW